MTNDIKIKDIKTQFVLPRLAGLPYRFKVFTDTGRYQRSIRQQNARISYINALLQTTDTDMLLLGGGLRAVAINLTLTFLIPVPDNVINEENAITDYTFVEDFREELESVFTTSEKTTLTANGKTYVGGVSASFPIAGELLQRQAIGQSIEYSCYLQFSYLANALNSSDVSFYLDGDTVAIPYTSYSVRRESTLSANTYSDAANNEGKTYAENSVFGVDLNLPAIDPTSSATALTIYNYLMGVESANTKHTLTIAYGAENTQTIDVIFGKTIDGGENITNVNRQISFVPYISAEDTDETDEESAESEEITA